MKYYLSEKPVFLVSAICNRLGVSTADGEKRVPERFKAIGHHQFVSFHCSPEFTFVKSQLKVLVFMPNSRVNEGNIFFYKFF